MKHKFVALIGVGIILTLTGCAGLETAGHTYLMKGQILEADNNLAYLCIGSHDGARVGQEFSVYKFVKISGPHKTTAAFKRKKTGTVKITEIVNEHFAKASVTAGDAKENYMVELNR